MAMDHNLGLDYAYVSLTITVSSLSIFGTLLIIGTYVGYPDLRTTSRKLLLYLSIADLITASTNIFGMIWFLKEEILKLNGTDVNLFCRMPAVIGIFSVNASFWWTVFLAIYLYICIAWNRHSLADKLVFVFHIVAWILPGTLAILSLTNDVVGYDKYLQNISSHASACWIKHDESVGMDAAKQREWQFLTGKAWEILAYILVALFYGLTRCHVRKEVIGEDPQYISRATVSAIRHADKKLMAVPIVFILCRIWGTIRFLIDGQVKDIQKVPGVPMDILMILQGIGDSAQGLANCILFCFCTNKIRTRLKPSFYNFIMKMCNSCSKCKCKCRKERPLRLPENRMNIHFNQKKELKINVPNHATKTTETTPILQ